MNLGSSNRGSLNHGGRLILGSDRAGVYNRGCLNYGSRLSGWSGWNNRNVRLKIVEGLKASEKMKNFVMLGTIHKRRPHRGGEGGWPKSRHTDIVREVFVQVNPKFGQGGEGSKIPKILRTSFMHGPKAVRISARHDQYRDTVT